MTMHWSTALPDWEARIVAGESLIPFPPLFPDEAAAALAVFKSLRIVDAPGSPTFGEACEQWVFDFVSAIFGAYDHEHGKRLIREFLLLISKKNSKSTLAAGIMVTALIRNWRSSCELLILAPTLEIAGNSFKPAADMVRADPTLVNLLHVQDNYRTITNLNTNATLKVVAADTDVVGGKKAAFILIDELWIFGKRPNADAMLREATGGLVSRPEGFVIYLSTQSDAPPAGVFKAKLEYFRDIRDGKLNDPRSLGVLYEFPSYMLDEKNKGYLDPANFYITNPNMGRSVFQDWLEEELIKANEPGSRRTYLAKHLNVEINMALRAGRWPGADHWEKAADPDLAAIYARSPFEALQKMIDRCECVVAGIDGGGLDDLFGLTFIGRVPGEIEVDHIQFGRPIKQKMKLWLSWSHAWCHEGVLKIRKTIANDLLQFQKGQELTISGDELVDIASIVDLIKMIKEMGKLGGVGVDPAGLGEMVSMLEEIGVTEENKLLRGAPQGFGMMNAIKTTERQLARGLMKHCGGLMMPWCVSNLKIEPTATAIRATKMNAGDAKIDPAMALFDAAVVMVDNPEPFKPAEYQMFMIA